MPNRGAILRLSPRQNPLSHLLVFLHLLSGVVTTMPMILPFNAMSDLQGNVPGPA